MIALDAQIIFSRDADQVIDCTSNEEKIDLVLMDALSLNEHAHATWMWLKTDHDLKYLPMMVIDNNENRATTWLNAGAVDIIDEATAPEILRARIRSQLEIKYKTDLLTRMMSLDGLTSLSNRARLDEYLDIEWRRSLREYYPLTLIKIDIDHFTAFNDRYGLGSGDQCLKLIARVLESYCHRAADMVSRYNSDEFMVLLPGVELDNGLQLAQRMVASVTSLCIEHKELTQAGYVSVSAGVASIEPSRDKRYQDLLDEVEEMLHSARQSGGNQARGIAL